MIKGILLHKADDDVGVAAMDLAAAQEIQALTLDGEEVTSIRLVDDVPLGHKVAMRDMAEGKHVLEYGREIGYASTRVKKGEHVHTHNLKSLRWSGKSQIVEHH
jgi:(2R)-sulfolactate sulfo-lyase subunit alpha